MQSKGRSWLPFVAVGAGALLGLLATLLVLWSKALVKDALGYECAQRASEVVDEVAHLLDERLVRVRQGQPRPGEVAAAWWIEGGAVVRRDPAGAPEPPRELLDAVAAPAAHPERARPITVRGPGQELAATWVPGGASGSGLLVRWDLDAIERDLVRPVLVTPPGARARFVAGLVRETETDLVLPFRTKAHDAFAPPLGFWRVGVGLEDPDGSKVWVRVQTLLLTALAVWLLLVLVGSVWVWSRREGEARRRFVGREQFLARAYHELQTPLALLRAAAETIERGAVTEPDDLAHCAAIVVREEARLTRTVRRLLRILRLEGGGQDDLAPARAEVEAVLEEQREAFAARGVSLESDVSAADASLLAPRDLVGDVARELLANVEKHARDATRVRVALEPVRRGLRLVVEDERSPAGPRASDAPRPATPASTGLGLSLLREGLDLAGGSLEIEERPLGRRVTMEVPCRKA